MMWKRDKPHQTAQDTFQTCCSGVGRLIDRARILGVAPAIVAAVSDYENRASRGGLWEIPQHDNVAGTVTKTEMERLYDYHFARSKGVARHIYDSIMHWAVDGKCPYCEHRPVASLDHFLPKTKYVSFAVSPSNLFGSCNECNHLKSDLAPSSAEELFFHPYFEDITQDEWLAAKVVEATPCAVVFSPRPPGAWPKLKRDRLAAQFEFFRLRELYTAQAAVELSEIRAALRSHHAEGGAVAVNRELDMQYNSRRAHRINSWRTALYKSLSESAWYCDGGFG